MWGGSPSSQGAYSQVGDPPDPKTSPLGHKASELELRGGRHSKVWRIWECFLEEGAHEDRNWKQ